MTPCKLTSLALFAALVAGAPLAQAAGAPAYLTLDHSSAALLDSAGAQAVWKAQLPDATRARLAKLYPVGKWGFSSQVEGGFNADKVCVVTARAMLLPRSGKQLTLKPEKSATTFDAKPGANQDQCRALAQDKLGEAIGAVLSSLVAAK